MTNHNSGENLLKDAEVYYEEMQRMFEKARPTDGFYCHPSVFRGKKLM